MAKGKIPGLRRVSKKEAHELSKLPWVPDEALSTTNDQARVLPDGRVLLYDPVLGGGTLYPSRAVAEEMKRQYVETERKALAQFAAGLPGPCVELLPPVDDFIRDVDAHAASLGKAIKVADEVLDRSVASLDTVDRALKRIPRAKRPVPEILTPLVAYVGEVMRSSSGGRWSKFPTTQRIRSRENEPIIQARNGRVLEPFVLLFLPMIEPDRYRPLRISVESDLHGAGYPQAPKPAA